MTEPVASASGQLREEQAMIVEVIDKNARGPGVRLRKRQQEKT
jgi:hypothetical protein